MFTKRKPKVNIFKKYNVPHDDLYGDLDKVWNVCVNKDEKVEQTSAVATLAAASAAGSGVSVSGGVAATFIATPLQVVFAPFLTGLVFYNILRVQFKVRKLWNNYKKNCTVYAENYVAKL